jgi:hypothetical protein
MTTNPFGTKPTTSTFGQSFGSAPTKPATTPSAPTATAPSTAASPAAGRRRVVADDVAPSSGVGAPDFKEERVFVSGEHYCYLYKLGCTKAGAHFFEMRFVGGDLQGKSVTVWQVAKNAMQAKELREMYIASGYPESAWQRDGNSKPMQPVPAMFMRSIGGGVWVPILMIGKFELRQNPSNSLNPFQKFLGFRPVVSRYTDAGGAQESFIVAPLPNLLPAEVGRSYGFAGTFYDWGSMKPTTVEMVAIDPVFAEELHFTRLDGSDEHPINTDNPVEVIG